MNIYVSMQFTQLLPQYKEKYYFFLFNNRGEWFEREFNKDSNNGIDNMIY